MKIEINKGDIIYVGRFKNKKQEVKNLGTDDHGQPTVNGRKVLTFRMEKFMKEDIKLAEILKEGQTRQFEKYADQTWRKLTLDQKIRALVAIKASGSGQIWKKYKQAFGE